MAASPAPVISDRTTAAWALMVQAHSVAFDRIEADMVRDASLPLAWHEVLARLAASEEPAMRMQDVARAVLLSKSGLTRLADRMEEAGLIERRACASDRRGVFLALTPAGREALERARPVFAAAIDRHFGRHLGPEELDGLTAAARRVIEGSGEAVDEGCANV
jgi:DNA-binding MarR family transcriptional regulator